MFKASCLCGDVTFEVSGNLPDAISCHCQMCRKATGHHLVSTEVEREQLKITRAENLLWYQSSTKARRGFCGSCGSTLFFDPPHTRWIAIAMGCFDGETDAKIDRHIFVDDKGDYYDIADGVPQERSPK